MEKLIEMDFGKGNNKMGTHTRIYKELGMA